MVLGYSTLNRRKTLLIRTWPTISSSGSLFCSLQLKVVTCGRVTAIHSVFNIFSFYNTRRQTCFLFIFFSNLFFRLLTWMWVSCYHLLYLPWHLCRITYTQEWHNTFKKFLLKSSWFKCWVYCMHFWAW